MSAQPDGNYTLLNLNGQRLALPQKDVVTVELASVAMEIQSDDFAASGLLQYENEEWRVFSLDSQMRVILNFLQEHRFCVCFGRDDSTRFALLCNEVSILKIDENMHGAILPPYLAVGNSPVTALLKLDPDMIVISDFERMGHYLYSVER